MIAARIEGFNRVLAENQPEFARLAVRVENVDLGDRTVDGMTSAWEPTPQELAMLNAGGKVFLQVLGSIHPPVALWCEGPR